MKITILKENLKEGLQVVERAVTESGTLPILKNILIETAQGKVKLSATNLEIAVTTLLFGKIMSDGAITIPFSALHGVVINSDSERIDLETKENILFVKGDNFEAKIQGMPAEDFPIIPRIATEGQEITVDGAGFAEALSEVVIATHISEIRPEISGVLFDFQVSALKLIGTDSFRLALRTLDHSQFTSSTQVGFKAAIPLKAVQEIIRIFSAPKPVHLLFDTHQVVIRTETTELISRLLEGTYPDYEQIIPKSAETELVIKKDIFINALRLVGTFSSKINDIRLKSAPDGQAIELYSRNQNVGENNYLIPAKLTGKPVEEIIFNWRYVLDGVRATKSTDVVLGVHGSNRPAFVKPRDGAGYFYLIMPIKGL